MLLLLLLLAAPAPAHGQSGIPTLINYQGELTNNEGNPVPSGTYVVEFRIWDHPTQQGQGNYIWGRAFPLHVATNGLFNVLLSNDGAALSNWPGAPAVADLLEAFAGPDRYLGLRVTDNPQGAIPTPLEISPRQRLVSAPYAVRARTAASADRATDADSLGGIKAASYAKLPNDLRGHVVPAVVDGALSDSALTASGINKIGINQTSPTQALDVSGNAVVSGSLSAARINFTLDSSAYLTMKDTGGGGVNPVINFDGNDWLEYSRANNLWTFLVGSHSAFSIRSNAVTAGGSVLSGAGDYGGFHFPLNPYGGVGDYANLKLNRAGTSGEDQVLSLNVGDDPGEVLQLNSTGNIELKANTTTNGTVSIRSTVRALNLPVTRVAGTLYTAETDGFVTFHGYHGDAHFTLQAAEGGELFHDNYYFWENNSDTMLATWPVAKGERYKWEFESQDGRGYCTILWRPLGLP